MPADLKINKTATLAIAAVWLGAMLHPFARGQSRTSVWDGVYTAQQAGRGEPAYQKECASCHGEKLEGKGTAPPLAGNDFTANWNGMTLGDLFEKIQGSMPADRPGELSPARNAAILAFLLKANSFPAGRTELRDDAEALKLIRFEVARPKQ
jgi:mono/diheme cytochrome c family protein